MTTTLDASNRMVGNAHPTNLTGGGSPHMSLPGGTWERVENDVVCKSLPVIT